MTDTLSSLRQQIDVLDGELVALLAQREALVTRVLACKRAENIPARIPSRVEEVIENAAAKAALMGASPDLARTVWTAMVEWFVLHEEQELGQR